MLADDLMWNMAKGSKLVKEASSEEEPVMVQTNKVCPTHTHTRACTHTHMQTNRVYRNAYTHAHVHTHTHTHADQHGIYTRYIICMYMDTSV